MFFHNSHKHLTIPMIAGILTACATPVAFAANGNIGVGDNALVSVTTGSSDTAFGNGALQYDNTGSFNTSVGYQSLYANTTGYFNVAVGNQALFANTTGGYGIAVGNWALYSNTDGWFNIAVGSNALQNDSTGGNNIAIGASALHANTVGYGNLALGILAGYNIQGNSNIDIGNEGTPTDNGVIRIGDSSSQTTTFIAGISGTNVPGALVTVNSSGQLGVMRSSERFKKDVKSIDDTTGDKLFKLRPVSFFYREKSEDGSNPLQYGLIAEEVAQVYPELVQLDKEGKPYTVYYHLLIPLLLNEVQKEHSELQAEHVINEAQRGEIEKLGQQQTVQQATMMAMLQQQKEQIATLQKQLQQLQANNDNNNASSNVALALKKN